MKQRKLMGMKNIYTAIEKWHVTEVSRRRQKIEGVGSRPEEKHKAWKQEIERTSIEVEKCCGNINPMRMPLLQEIDNKARSSHLGKKPQNIGK